MLIIIHLYSERQKSSHSYNIEIKGAIFSTLIIRYIQIYGIVYYKL